MRSTKAHLTEKGKERIMKLKFSMNKARTEYSLPSNHRVVVTFPWLLGLIEGDGCFSFNGLVPRLSIQLNNRQEYVLLAIKNFFGGIGNIRREESRTHSGPEANYISEPMVILEFNQISFLRNVIVPGFKALPMLSKKCFDFSDWAICVELYFTGHHTLQKGKDLVLLLKSRMNNNRLSTNPGDQRDLLISPADINTVFELPAPYEVRGGARNITGSNKLVPEAFPVYLTRPDGSTSLYPSLSQCALALGISRKPIRKYIDSGTPYQGNFFTSSLPSSTFDQS
jgi:LAGLIDADG endonuclease